MTRGPDAATLLRRALERSAPAEAAMLVRDITSTRWASATFAGERHELAIELAAGAAGDAWLGGLADAELPMRGHLVADLAVVRTERSGDATVARIEALTVEDR